MTATITFTKPQTKWIIAKQIDESNFYQDEKERFVNEDCRHRVKGGQCLLRKAHIGNHIVSFNKSVLSILMTNNILIKVLSSNWRVW